MCMSMTKKWNEVKHVVKYSCFLHKNEAAEFGHQYVCVVYMSRFLLVSRFIVINEQIFS